MSDIEYLNRLELEFERLVATGDASARRPGRPHRLVPRSPFARVASALAVAAVVAVAIGLLSSSPGSDEVSNASAAQILKQAANSATLPGNGVIPDGRYLHWTATVDEKGQAEIVSQFWLSNTGAGRWVSNQTPFSNKRERFDETFANAEWSSASHKLTIPRNVLGISRYWYPFGIDGPNGYETRGYSYPQMLKFPHTADALLRLAGATHAPPVMQYQSLAWFASQVALPADTRAAVFKALAKMPGIKRTDATTVDGQHLVGIAYYLDTSPKHLDVVEFLLNPQTGYVAQVRGYPNATVDRLGGDRIKITGQPAFTMTISTPTLSDSTN